MDQPDPGTSTVPGAEGVPAQAVVYRVAPQLDPVFYRAHTPSLGGDDPAAHYCRIGWREGRDPNGWFSTDYYLRANPDIRQSGVNPFWHYLVQGRREGRRPRAAGAVWRAALDRATVAARSEPAAAGPPPPAPALGADELRRLIGAACSGARGFVVAISHDRYIEVPGGTQLLIADEQRKFNGDHATYLHLSPLTPAAGLAPRAAAPDWLAIVLDGALRGVATAGSVALALASLAAGATAPLPRLLIVHALHGHRPEAIAAIAAALRPLHAFFWVHDYTAACASPQLLRNDIEFCHAPAPDSLACRVCVHGPGRPQHLARVRALFEAVPFHVVAPSQCALESWWRATDLPILSARVHPHASLKPTPTAAPGGGEGTPRVAFVGHAGYRKGWTRFRELVAAVGKDAGVSFFHFASADELRALDGVTPVAAEASPARPFGMVRAFAEHRIDLVLALSPWPETFGYTAHEALAAGADLLATAGSGHVAELARTSTGSLLLADDDALVAFFKSGDAVAHVLARRAAGRAGYALLHDGSTATIGFDPAVPAATEEPDLHLLLRGTRLDGSEVAGRWRFALPAGDDPKRTVRLRSRSMRGAWDRAAEGERRRLGVAVASVVLDGAEVPAGDPRRASGWHQAETGWQWTDGDAVLNVGAARELEVTVLPFARYWRSPLLAVPKKPA